MKEKSRDLSTYEFFEIIQIEYLCALLRARIYQATNDKYYWHRVAEGKRRTIEDISSRNCLPSVLTDSDLEAALSRRLYRDETYPIFTYRNEEQKLSQEYFDLLHYYSIGSEVIYIDPQGERLVGKVSLYQSPFKGIEVISNEGKTINTSIDKVVRIL